MGRRRSRPEHCRRGRQHRTYRDRRDHRRSLRRHRPVPHRGPRGAARRPGREDPQSALARTGDRRGIRRAVEPGDAAARRPAARAALVLGLRHASRAGPPQRVAAVPHGRRRPGRALPARPLPRTRRPAAGDHPWLARLGGGVPEGDRSAHRPRRPRRRPIRRVPRGRAVAAGLRMVRQAGAARLGRSPDRRSVGAADAAPGLRPLRCPGRRLGVDGHDGDGDPPPHPPGGDPREHADRDPRLGARGDDAGRGVGRRITRALHDLGQRILLAAVDATADPRLRIGGLAGRADGVDRGEVLVMDRLRRRPAQHPHRG